MKTLRDIPHLQGVKALVRVDFNVPIKNGKVTDDFRVRSALPTIEFLRKNGAKVILISHLESNDGGNPSLEPVAKHLNGLAGQATFIKDWKDANGEIEMSPSGSVFLLENLRFFEGEKANDPRFARELASLGDIYVNEAFSVDHREHASIVGVPKYISSYAGLQLEKEIANLSKAFNPTHPFLFILGGAKFETKLPLLEKFMDIADMVFVGGALANDLFKAKGYEIGRSLISDAKDLGRYLKNQKLALPVDIVNGQKETKPADGMSADDQNLDAGPKTVKSLRVEVAKARFILWNGPLGMYEDGYKGPTLELAKIIAERTERGARDAEDKDEVQSIVGGGDTLAAIAELGIEDRFTFISTGGGAMLDFLAKGTLPGIEALERSGI